MKTARTRDGAKGMKRISFDRMCEGWPDDIERLLRESTAAAAAEFAARFRAARQESKTF